MMRSAAVGGGRTKRREPNLGMPFRGDPMNGMGRPGGGMIKPPKPRGQSGPDYFGQLNAFQADIGGEQPGPLSAGWGGAGGRQGDTMTMTKVNSWLNTFQDPIERAKAMNGIGYNNYGNPYTPEAPKGTNRFYRGNARENQQTGGYSAPGTYLHQSSYAPLEGGMPNMNFGGIIGATNVSADGSAQYNPFDINARGRIRRTRTFGNLGGGY